MNTTEYGDPTASNILIQLVDDLDLKGIENENNLIAEICKDDFRLIAMKVNNMIS